jgi:hypothetical protein
MAQNRMTPPALLDQLQGADTDVLRRVLEHAVQRLIDAEAATQIGAGPHERSASRTTYRNGYREQVDHGSVVGLMSHFSSVIGEFSELQQVPEWCTQWCTSIDYTTDVSKQPTQPVTAGSLPRRLHAARHPDPTPEMKGSSDVSRR